MSIIDDIKARLDIVDVIGASVKLRRAGKNYVGLCPFHNEKTPSFIVFPGTQTWHCFGQCGTGGSIFDFVMKKEGWEFPEALRHLASKAGVPLRPMSAEEQRNLELKRERGAVLGAAAAFFRQRLGIPDAGQPPALFPLPAGQMDTPLAYAVYQRGMSLETLRSSSTGYFGKDWNALREHLRKAGIDLESPAAVALVGYRGDVAEWGRAHGINPAKGWIEDQKIPAMPPDMLIYAHMVHGRVVYISGRRLAVEGDIPKSWNPPEELVGPRQPFFNQVWFGDKTARSFVIVEGQMDALTLGQWGIPAVALAGCAIPAAEKTDETNENQTSIDNYLLSELKRKMTSGARILVGMDQDEAGKAAQPRVVTGLLEQGFTAMQVGNVRWPADDVNDWLTQDGGTASQANALLQDADLVLESLIRAAEPDNGRSDEDAVRALFAELARLTPFEVERVREEICDRINLRRRVFDGLLKAARRDAGQGDDGQPAYFVEGGRIFARYYDARGGETVESLCNFAAEIRGDVLRDNGQDIIREFHIRGSIGKYNLPLARVRADEFAKMDWVLSAWGSRAIIEAGARRRDQLRAAIQHLSRNVERRIVYTHTGWREYENGNGPKRVYLSAAGAVGGESVDVELDRDLELYAIPPIPEKPAEAMRLSLQFLDVAPDRISFPIWGAMYLPPLRELVNVAFALWVYGASGTMKSTYVALAMNHYGPGFDDKHLPASFIDTANRLEQKSFVIKDAPLVVDDFAPQKDANSARMYTNTAHRLVRAAGNLAGRGRLSADSTARTTYDPRSLIIITGEDVPESESLVARLFVVELNRGDVDKARLSALQAQRDRLSHAMSGYLAWAAEHWEGWKDTVPVQWRRYRQQAFEAGYHLRLPEAVAGLMTGIEMGLRYALVMEVINTSEYNQLLHRGWAALMEGASAMANRVQEEKPEQLFIRTLSDLLTQGKIYLRGAESIYPPLGGPAEHSEMMGWYDKDYLYLLPDAIYARIVKHFREQGSIFPVRDTTLRKMLWEAGMIEVETSMNRNGKTEVRRTKSVRVEGAQKRCLVVKRAFLSEPEEENPENQLNS